MINFINGAGRMGTGGPATRPFTTSPMPPQPRMAPGYWSTGPTPVTQNPQPVIINNAPVPRTVQQPTTMNNAPIPRTPPPSWGRGFGLGLSPLQSLMQARQGMKGFSGGF